MIRTHAQIKLAYYGDDFTGSTDALDFLHRSGIPTVLFMEPPEVDTLLQFPHLQAFGVAGTTRSLGPEDLRRTLRPALQKMAAHHPAFLHYKVCSTFDSSPTTGSIGVALETGRAVLRTPCVPVVPAQPDLGRYLVFGNLFARMGTHTEGPAYRIDRHPSMSRHPVTPALDGDLRDHLRRQTHLSLALLDILQLSQPMEAVELALEDCLRDQPEVLLFDLLERSQLARIGDLVSGMHQPGRSLFIVGSSAVEAALCAHWGADLSAPPGIDAEGPPSPVPMLVLSGSCSPVTALQIEAAVRAGFAARPLEVAALARRDADPKALEPLAREMVSLLGEGRSVIAHTCDGEMNTTVAADPAASRRIGSALGYLAQQCLVRLPRLQRICLAGGDTSSHAAMAMGIRALEVRRSFVPGSPLCLAHADLPEMDGREINFKGGQVGQPDYFRQLRDLVTRPFPQGEP